jgi:hypothetical protein
MKTIGIVRAAGARGAGKAEAEAEVEAEADKGDASVMVREFRKRVKGRALE